MGGWSVTVSQVSAMSELKVAYNFRGISYRQTMMSRFDGLRSTDH
jgi:hypothetical protein